MCFMSYSKSFTDEGDVEGELVVAHGVHVGELEAPAAKYGGDEVDLHLPVAWLVGSAPPDVGFDLAG